jgi:uncharacterized membrane protein
LNTPTTETLLRFTGDWPALPVVGVALALAAIMFFYYRRELRMHEGVSRWLPALLRALAVFILVLCLAGPVLRHVTTFRQLGRVVVVVDASASMSYADATAQGTESSKNKSQTTKLESRFTRAEHALLDPENSLIKTLSEQHDVDLFVLRGYRPERVWWRRGGGRDTSGELPSTFDIKPDATITNLDQPLRDALGPSPAGTALVVLTDGQHNAPGSPEELAASLKESSIPVFTVGYGSEMPPPDLALLNVLVPEAVFAEDRAEGIMVINDSLPAGLPATASITHANKVLWQETFTTHGSGERRIEFSFPVHDLAMVGDPKQSLRLLSFRVDLTGSAAEQDRIKENNSRSVALHLLNRKRKVLILDGRARWETRYLKNHFDRDERWKVAAAFDDYNPGLSTSIQAVFPKTADDLMSYDLIVLGDLRPGAISAEQQQMIAKFINERGGGLILVDGRRGHLKEWQQTEVAPLLPVSWTSEPTGNAPFTYGLTQQGLTIDALRMSDSASGNANVWKKLPPAMWSAAAKPLADAAVLGEVTSKDKKTSPALVWRRFGAGSVLWLSTDELWRWRFEVADQHHQRFWMQAATWIAAPPFMVDDKRISLGTDRLRYAEGDTAELRVRLRDEKGAIINEAKPRAHVFRNGLEIASLELESDPNHGGVFRAITGALPSGDYQINITEGATPNDAHLNFRVESQSNQEWASLTMNRPLLEGMARASGGRFLREGDLSQLPDLLQQLDRSETRVNETLLWSSWWWFGAVIGLLTAEWLLRKKWRMV